MQEPAAQREPAQGPRARVFRAAAAAGACLGVLLLWRSVLGSEGVPAVLHAGLGQLQGRLQQPQGQPPSPLPVAVQADSEAAGGGEAEAAEALAAALRWLRPAAAAGRLPRDGRAAELLAELGRIAAPAAAASPSATGAPAPAPPAAAGQDGAAEWDVPFPPLPEGRNPEVCGFQPSRKPLPSRPCPIPGLNNLLYSTHNRYYCAARDGWRQLLLRDRSCHKHSADYYRFSSLLEVNASRTGGPAPAVCWGDDQRDPPLRRCEWKHIPEWYGSPEWWRARAHIDFRPPYYAYARLWARRSTGGRPYVALHLRRGDYKTHCAKLRRKREPAWLSFSHDRRHRALSSDAYGAGCYPAVADIESGARLALAALGTAGVVFVSTNDPGLVGQLASRGRIPAPVRAFPSDPRQLRRLRLRPLDAAVVDMALISLASAWVLNRYSSFSGTAYEMATLHGRMNRSALWWW
eukprot:TRINITY_DN13829_c0_g3_i1.p1 TRINITY_DN13829_c0_g3~~TRINITY_DN13829_c0_g3_i1.p1  ORF type:complete len:489 (+),score=153.95 TRINITY_DN13829_c0_g3_i1:81-1469(+)